MPVSDCLAGGAFDLRSAPVQTAVSSSFRAQTVAAPGSSHAPTRVVAPGLFFRGGALVGATESDCAMLFGTLGIKCVVDVRCGWEREAKPDILAPGVEYLHIPFYDLDIVGIEYTRPAEGTKAVGRDVACEPDHYYRSLANPLTVGQMRKGLHAVFEHALEGLPVYQHCSGGKDRSGMLALLTLTILGASSQDILDDYLFTNVARDKNHDKMMERFLRFTEGDEQRARELTEAHRARPQNIQAFYEAVEEAYGDMASFVHNQLGFDDELIARIRETCTVERQPVEQG